MPAADLEILSCRGMSASVAWHANSFTYTPDVDAYFKRIGYTGSKELCIETLNQIQWLHLLAIPYENLDIHIPGGKIDLAPEVVERKLVTEGRGGYCFEHNTLAMYVLKALGFDVTPVLARTRWQRLSDFTGAATHLVLKVNLQGVLWLFDVGFSSFGSGVPLLIETEETQLTSLNESRRIIKTDESYIHQLFSREGKWVDMYVFTLHRSYPVDWEVGSYYCSTHPTCTLLDCIIVAKPTEVSRVLLLNKTFTTRYPDGTSESREITTEEEYVQVLRSVFKLTLPEDFHICPPKMSW